MLDMISRNALASDSKSVKTTEPHATALRLMMTGQCLAQLQTVAGIAGFDRIDMMSRMKRILSILFILSNALL